MGTATKSKLRISIPSGSTGVTIHGMQCAYAGSITGQSTADGCISLTNISFVSEMMFLRLGTRKSVDGMGNHFDCRREGNWGRTQDFFMSTGSFGGSKGRSWELPSGDHQMQQA